MADAKAQFEALTPEQQAKFLEGRSQEDIAKIKGAGIDTSVSGVMDAVKNTKQYQDLLGKGFTEDQIMGEIQNYQDRGFKSSNKVEPVKQEEPVKPVEAPQVIQDDKRLMDLFKQGTAEQQKELIAKIEEGIAVPKKDVEAVKVADIVPKFGYETTMLERADRNQQIASKFFEQDKKVLDTEKIFNEISLLAPNVSAEEVQNTVDDIQSRFEKLKRTNELSTIDSTALAQQIATGEMSLSDIEGLKETDPGKYAEITNLVSEKNKIADYNNRLQSTNDIFSDERISTSLTFLDSINKRFTEALAATDGEDSLAKYQEAINDPELAKQKDKLSTLQGDISEIDRQLNNITRDVEEEFKGASDSLINSVIRDRAANLQEQKNSLLIEAQTTSSLVNNKITNAQENYRIDLQKEQMQRENIIQSYGMTMDMFDKQRQVLNRQLDKEDAMELQKMSLLEQLDVSKATDSMIDELNAGEWVKDYLKFKKALPQSFEIKDTFEFNGGLYGIDKYGNSKKILGGSSDYSGFNLNMNIQRPAGSKNVGKDVNNPGNITADGFSSPEGKAQYGESIGASGTYISPNGREYYVFDTPEDGARALRDFTKRIVSGNSPAYDPNMTMTEFVRTYTGEYNKNYLAGLENITGNPASGIGVDYGDVMVRDINPDKLAEGLAFADSGMDIKGLGYSVKTPKVDNRVKQLSDDAQNILFGMKLTSLGQDKRSPVITEIRSFIDSNRDNFIDDNAYAIARSVVSDKTLTDGSKNKLTSISNVKFQLEGLEDTLNNVDTGPLRELYEKTADKWTDQDTAELRMQLEAIIPDLARGVFGEKGVLTDTDIERYRKTIPNMGNKADVNSAIAQNLKDILKNTFISVITTEANGGTNVYNFMSDYEFWAGQGQENTSGQANSEEENISSFIDMVEGLNEDGIISSYEF